jgi:hypothetical protein
MPKILKIPTYANNKGSLSVIEKIIPFKIKRVYYLYNFKKKNRGQHKHKKNRQFLICLFGNVVIKVISQNHFKSFSLSKPNYGLLLDPKDWHEIIPKSGNPVLLVLASQFFSKKDYIDEV